MSETKKQSHGIFTYLRRFLTNKETYASGESGWAMLNISSPLTILDITIQCPEKTFIVGEIDCGDAAFVLTGEVRAESFSPKLKNREFEKQQMQRGDTVIVRFRNVYSDKDEPIDIVAKVAQERST
jgi:hypothetical protein